MQVHPKYRPDIDGLRAVAVLAVVFFHAFPSALPGGFVGVDVFFVISGFLISTILYGNIERNQFSFQDFYGRRIRRIFPALALVLISTYAFSWFALLAPEFKDLGFSLAAGAGFISNFALWSQSGYFDSASELKPLLHLWSLGIEEQFYILWPIVLLASWRIQRSSKGLLFIAALLAFISFGLNFIQLPIDAVGTFYSPSTRVWELLAGAILAHAYLHPPTIFRTIAISKMWKEFGAWLGVVLIAVALFCFSKNSQFPGWRAILPVMGSLLIIGAGPQAWLNRVVLSHRFFVWIGLVSYPLYLWHWPLLAMARIINGSDPSSFVKATWTGQLLIDIFES